MGNIFVLFVNGNGFIDVDGHFVNNVTKARMFFSREDAVKYRSNLYSQAHGFHNTISILEWL